MSLSRCPNCGSPIRPDARFCGVCGKPITSPPLPHAQQPAARQSGNVCPKCGNINRPTARFCSVCQTSLTAQPAPGAMPPPPPVQKKDRRVPMGLIHILLMALLVLPLCSGLFFVYSWESANPTPTPITPSPTATRSPTLTPTQTLTPMPSLTPTPLPKPTFVLPTEPPTATLNYPGPVVQVGFNSLGRFGLATTIGDPSRPDDDYRNLTYSKTGDSNNTRVYVDGDTPIFGERPGTTVALNHVEGNTWLMDWEYKNIRVTQRVAIVVGSITNRYDTLRIEYAIQNRDTISHQVGLRMMLDTYIGANDGVPFAVPGITGIVDHAVDLRAKQPPDFIDVLEQPSLVNPGVIVKITLRGGEATPPERVLITGFLNREVPWNYLDAVGGVGAPMRRNGAVNGVPDSAIGLYYPIEPLAPGERRQIVTFYGLGTISSVTSRNPNLGVSISSNRVDEGASFYIVARVSDPRAGQQVRLQLPPELLLVEGTPTQAIAPEAGANFTTRSWLVRAVAPSGGAEIAVSLEPMTPPVVERQSIVIVRRPTPTPTVTSTVTVTPSPTFSRTPTATPTVGTVLR